VEFRVLGPLEALDEGRQIPLGGARQRAVLAFLLTRANEAVAVDRLIDEIWGAEPPRTAANTIQYYISQLRKLLGADRIVTRPPGYLIRVERGELDLERFERLLDEGTAESLRDALGLWRGRALADFAYEPFAQAEIGRLEELRLAALEKRVDADLELGRHAEIVGELEQLIAEHPLRERLRGQLMLALYRSGRQAEALASYQAARSTLVDELGIEPGPPLQELERAMLRQDPSLDASGAGRSAPAEPNRAILVVPLGGADLSSLLAIAQPLALRPPRELIVAGLLAGGDDLAATTALLAEARNELAGRGVQARVAAYTSETRGADVVLLATEQDVDLVLVDALPVLLERGEAGADLEAILESAPCDVGVLVKAGSLVVNPSRPVVVPFGGVDHDWAAVEIAAWIARSIGVTLRLAGTAGGKGGRRDASRLLARASLAVQAAVGVVAEPALVRPGAEGVLEAAADASLLVVGLSERWRSEGLGEARLELARANLVPTLLVRHGLRPGGLAPPETMTRFTWTLSAG
jgi:DNA-binding SARP family transcriptional activator